MNRNRLNSVCNCSDCRDQQQLEDRTRKLAIAIVAIGTAIWLLTLWKS